MPLRDSNWKCAISPKGRQEVGYLSVTSGRTTLRMNGAYYDVQELLDAGWILAPLVAMTPERVEALWDILGYATYWHIGLSTMDEGPEFAIVRAMLNELAPQETTH